MRQIILVMAGSALLGGFVFSCLDHALNNAGAFLRKLSTLRTHPSYLSFYRSHPPLALENRALLPSLTAQVPIKPAASFRGF